MAFADYYNLYSEKERYFNIPRIAEYKLCVVTAQIYLTENIISYLWSFKEYNTVENRISSELGGKAIADNPKNIVKLVESKKKHII